MIARNPKNHDDQWLVAAQYFSDNFEAFRSASERDGLVENVAICCDCSLVEARQAVAMVGEACARVAEDAKLSPRMGPAFARSSDPGKMLGGEIATAIRARTAPAAPGIIEELLEARSKPPFASFSSFDELMAYLDAPAKDGTQ
jgi:hypothetical protein